MYRLKEFSDLFNDCGQVVEPVTCRVNRFLDKRNMKDFEIIRYYTVFLPCGYFGVKKPVNKIVIKYKVR